MLLSVSRLETSYGASQALFGVDLAVAEGEVVALMGRNGMGKTTTIATLLGLLKAKAGTVSFAGADITRLPAYRIARRGIGLVPEGRRCFPNLTVRENLVAAARGDGCTVGPCGHHGPPLSRRPTSLTPPPTPPHGVVRAGSS